MEDFDKMRYKNIIGNKYERLKVIKYIGNNKYNRSVWECKCDCGKICIADKNVLQQGHKQSCGCLNHENHLFHPNRKSHGKCGTRLYRIWKKMKSRCNNKNDIDYKKWYGSRGIKVCDEWQNNFLNFYNWAMNNGYSDSLSIDRINVNGNYEPSNCKWSSDIEQANNRRTSKDGDDL